VALLSTRKDLQDAINQTRDTVAQNSKNLDTASAVDPSERLKFLNAQLAAAQAHKLEAKNSLAAAEENTNRLKQRLADMERQVTAKLDECKGRFDCRRNTKLESESFISSSDTAIFICAAILI